MYLQAKHARNPGNFTIRLHIQLLSDNVIAHWRGAGTVIGVARVVRVLVFVYYCPSL
jgi:hypothetical protein